MTATASRPTTPDLSDDAGQPGDWLSGRGGFRRGQVLASVLVGLLVASVAWLLRTGVVPTDPWQYVQSAINFPSDRWVPLGYTRYGMILPLLPLVAAFGNTEVVYYVMPLLGTALLATSISLIALRFWGRSGAVLAVLLAFASPIVVINLSRGYPDVQSTGLCTLAMVLALHARDLVSPGRPGRAESVPAPLLLGIGFLLGWAFEARETTVFIWPLVALILLWGRSDRRRTALLVLLAMGVWAVADLAIGAFGYGDALMRVHAFTRQDLAATTNPADLAVQAEFVGRDRLFYLTAVPRLLLTEAEGGWWTVVIGAVGLLGLFSLRGGTRFAAICLAVTFLGFVGIAGFFSPSHPSGRIDVQRYWIGFLPFTGLAAAGVLSELVDLLAPRARGRGLTRRAVALLVVVAACLGPMVSLTRSAAANPALVVNGGDQLSRLRSYLSEQPDQPVRLYTDWYTQRLLPIYTRPAWGGDPVWQGEILSLTGRKAKPQPGDLVAINSLNDNSCIFCRRVINEWYAEKGPIPSTWERIWATPEQNLVLYRVTG